MGLFGTVAGVIFAVIAVSYGWGMRGYIIGGEKGAMLPGALLGFSMAVFCADGQLIGYLPFFCGAGALSMFYGGTEPYAQTMSYILRRDDKECFAYNNVKKGVTGIFLKGGLWFGICASVLSILPGALSGKYSKTEIITVFALIPFLSLAGTRLFNSPFDGEKKIFPKIYFSNGSREEWGANVLILTELILIGIIKKDYFVPLSAAVGFLSGGTGFTSGLIFYDLTVRKHRGKYIFGMAQERKLIDGWKIMEHTFGAVGGGGVMLWFCLNSRHLVDLLSSSTEKIIAENSNTSADGILAVAVVLLLLLTFVQYPVSAYCKKKSGKEPDIHIFELLERPCFSAIPLIFVFCGYRKAATAVAVLSVAYVLCEKCCVEWFSEFRNSKRISVVFALVFLILTTAFFCGVAFGAVAIILIYTFGYTLCVLYKSYNREQRLQRRKSHTGVIDYYKSRLTVDFHFVVQCAFATAVTLYTVLR